MKKIWGVVLISALLLTMGVMGLRSYFHESGRAVGYHDGYQYGFSDGEKGETRDSQILAGEVVEYRYGGSSWKGYMMGFPEGYKNGQENAGNKINN